MFIVMQLANRQNIIRKWGNGQPYGLSSSEEKKIHSQKAEAIPAVACREAYDSLYTIEGRGDAHISK
jgi:hypothetical protein